MYARSDINMKLCNHIQNAFQVVKNVIILPGLPEMPQNLNVQNLSSTPLPPPIASRGNTYQTQVLQQNLVKCFFSRRQYIGNYLSTHLGLRRI